MAIFSPTVFYFGQPILPGGLYKIRPDTYSTSVSLALPGTQFGNEFGQTNYRSDISGYINGGSSLTPTPPVTGSPAFPSSSVNFPSDGYTTSIARGADNVANYTFPGNATNINFGTGDFTIEGWFNPADNTTSSVVLYFAYSNQFGFVLWSAAGYYRWVAQNSAGSEALVDYSTTNPQTGTWVHIAFCRSGSTWYACLNGTIRGNITLSGATGTGGAMNCMNWPGASQRASTWQDFRITKGVARYTGAVNATYTVPESIVMNA
jgi:hypothetical protein